MNNNTGGDMSYAKRVSSQYPASQIQFEVYSAKYHCYVTYSAHSKPQDFLYIISFIQCLDPNFIELLKQ